MTDRSLGLATDTLPVAPHPPSGFDLCHPGLVLRAVFIVQSVIVVGALLQAESWRLALAVGGPAVLAGLVGTLSWLSVACLVRRALARATPAQRWVAVTLLGAACGLFGFALLLPFGGGAAEATRWVAVALAGGGLAAGLWAWLVLRLRSRLPAETTARLAELQSRIRPHFLFNALNSAIALVRIDPPRAEGVLEDLSSLIRVALANQGEAVTLDDEVELAQRYLAIEQVRFGERLRVRWDLAPEAGRARLPALLLQPLVENAVRHGVEPAAGGGDIVVCSEVKRGQAVLTIVNTVASGAASAPGHGIALANVRERLHLLHDVAAQFQAGPEPGGFRVRIEVPL